MRPKSLMLLALALGCGLVASIGISQVMDKQSRQTGPSLETAPIYVALHGINIGDPIDATMVSLQEWPKDKIPQGAIAELENLEGRRPRASIIEGEPILDGKLLARGQFADPITSIPRGYRLSTISVDAEKSAAGLLSPGDRVDIQLFVNRNERAGVEWPMTKVILQNVRVFAVEQAVQRAADGEARTIPKTVSLLVTPEQASRIELAQNLGELSLIPRNPNDENMENIGEVTAQDLLEGLGGGNSRSKEQVRTGPSVSDRAGSIFGGLMAMMQSEPEEQLPFSMEVVLADDVSVKMFDARTGRPLTDYNENRAPTQLGQPTTAFEQAVPESPADEPMFELPTGSELPTGNELDFPIELK